MHQPRIYCDELWLICQRAWVNIISFTVSSGADKSLFSSTWKHIFRCHTRLFCVAARCTPHICGVFLFPQIFAHVCSSKVQYPVVQQTHTKKKKPVGYICLFSLQFSVSLLLWTIPPFQAGSGRLLESPQAWNGCVCVNQMNWALEGRMLGPGPGWKHPKWTFKIINWT